MMQVPEFYRRGVVRPLDEAAAEQLADFRIVSSIRTEWIPVLSDDHFGDLWDSGIFQRINEACGSSISDYEEVELRFQQLPSALKAVQEMEKLDGNVIAFCNSLEGMIVDAIESKRNVYFIL